MGLFRSKPEEVFTPRAPLNEKMYVERRKLEKSFSRAIRGHQHLAIFGESGSGKTWLYQKTLKQKNSAYRIVDLSVAMTAGLDNAFRSALSSPYGWSPDSKSSIVKGGISQVIEAGVEKNTQYTFADEPPFDKLIKELAQERGNSKFLVFDNLEQISDQKELMRALSSYIIRLDNPRFQASQVRFLFVGIVTDMRDLLSHGASTNAIANRINELPEVKRLTSFEATNLLRTGFFDLLKVEFEDEESVIESLIYYSGRNAQQLHELGLNVAFTAEKKNWSSLSWDEDVSDSVIEWAGSNLAGYRDLVLSRLNKTETRAQRKNQVLYCVAKEMADDFSPRQVEEWVRDEFPHTVSVDRLGIDQILRGLADGENEVLIRDQSSNRYSFKHPKIRIAIRFALCKDKSGNIARNPVNHLPVFD